MLRDRQEVLAVGELAVFLAAWLLSATVAVDYYRHRGNLVPSDRVAANEATLQVPVEKGAGTSSTKQLNLPKVIHGKGS